MNLTSFAPENLPRERLQAQGAGALSNAELVALILKSGTKQDNILDLCQKLLAKYSLEQLAQASLQQLQQEHGIGVAKASQLIAVFELGKRLTPKVKTTSIRTAKDIAETYLVRFAAEKQENFVAVYLDTKHKIIADQVITKGTLNMSLIHPREVFYGAIKHCAHSLIVLHNHPSGDPTPSEEDLRVTQVLQETGEIMQIPVVDHIILGHTSWWSWREQHS